MRSGKAFLLLLFIFSYGERQFTNSKRPDLMFSGAQLLVIFNISKN